MLVTQARYDGNSVPLCKIWAIDGPEQQASFGEVHFHFVAHLTMLSVAENTQHRFDILWCDTEVSIYLRHLLHLCMLKRETVPKKH
jgi:hypothetical protein